MKNVLKVLALTYGACASVAMAHHSTSAYDYSKTQNLTVTVQEFRWTNPHIFLLAKGTDSGRKTATWNIECGTPNINVRHGWKKDDLRIGDKIQVAIHPMRDGTPGGTLINVKLADGRILYGPGNDIISKPGS